MVEVFVDFYKSVVLLRMLNEKHEIGLDAEKLEKGCPAWDNYTKKKKFEPYKKLIPLRPDLYYKKGNADWEKTLDIISELEYIDGIQFVYEDDILRTQKYSLPKGKKASDIAKKCGVSSQDVTNFIKINRIADKILDQETF